MTGIGKRLQGLAATSGTVGPLRAAAVAPLWVVQRRFAVSTLALDRAALPADADAGSRWEVLRGRALDALIGINPLLERREVRRRAESGMLCYACRVDGEIVHYRWYATGAVWLPFLGLRWVPEKGDYTALDVFTVPGMRNRGLHKRFSVEGLDRARAAGLRRAVAFVAWWNGPSLAVLDRMGFRTAGSATLWRLAPFTLHTATGRVRIRERELRVLP